MANALFDTGRKAFLDGGLAWLTEDFRVILIDAADYVVDLVNHDFLDDIAAGARVSVSGALGSKDSTAGVADAADVVLSSVSGDPSEALVIYQHTGVDGTSQLVAYIDTATGLPVTPNGADINILWDNGANRIFKL